MAALINALDSHTSKQFGENGHAEYGWSNNIRERIIQFSFQLTRTDDKGANKLSSVLKDILSTLKLQRNSLYKLKQDSDSESDQVISQLVVANEYLIILYKMIGQTRDIIDGKGECLLTYMMIYTWYEFFPELALYALRCLVHFDDDNGKTHQYGSWKDIKYFCNYCHNKMCDVDHPLIQYAINLVNTQINTDYANLISNSNEISLVGRWVPREKSNKFGWMYEALACNYFPMYIESASSAKEQKRDSSKAAALLKTKMEYRKVLSALNKQIDTLQIKQCGKTWAEIDFKNVTSVSLSKQRKAFLNVTKKGLDRFPCNADRVECAEHFNAHIQKAIKGEIEIKGKRVGLENFTKQAIDLINSSYSRSLDTEKAVLNSQWRDNSTQTGALGDMIAMVDVSGSMCGDPLNAAIALGIRVAEKSKLGKRVMTFSASPKWVNLEDHDNFVSMVDTLQRSEWGMNTNFDAALNMILNAIVEAKMEPEDVEGLTLVIFSDMQMDSADSANRNTNVLYDRIREKYADAGMRVKGRPYKPPHILFWNLRSTSGFPTLSTQQNASMMSGFSPAMLNLFCEQGVESLQACSPWSLFLKSLENERYSIMEIKARGFFW
jgi:hypothetical protein